jgi:hypothetical protein
MTTKKQKPVDSKVNEILLLIIFIAGVVVGALCAYDYIKKGMIDQGRAEILTGKTICVLKEFKDFNPVFDCKSKEEVDEDIKFLNTCCRKEPPKQKGSPI